MGGLGWVKFYLESTKSHCYEIMVTQLMIMCFVSVSYFYKIVGGCAAPRFSKYQHRGKRKMSVVLHI